MRRQSIYEKLDRIHSDLELVIASVMALVGVILLCTMAILLY